MTLTELKTGRFRAGQVWKFKSRPTEPGATLTVLRVESNKVLGVIVHVAVSGLRIKNPQAPGGHSDEIQHLPFREEAIAKSVTELVGETQKLGGEEGYRTWRTAFEAGKAGVFTVTVAEAIAGMEQALNP